jgi:hypothetical protein
MFRSNTLFSTLKAFYRRLPLIRELRDLNSKIDTLTSYAKAQSDTNQLLRLQQLAAYEEQLLSSKRYLSSKNLNNFQFQVFSQHGEDGIIAEIFRRIGVKNRAFFEIGVGNGLENNTAYLLFQGWRGAWIEGDKKSIQSIYKHFAKPIADNRLKTIQSFVTAENVEAVAQSLQIPLDVDCLSIDIDRNTYWIWNALPAFKPRVVVVEYNASIPPDLDWKAEYAPDHLWDESIYYGASLKALELLGSRFGYSLVGCSLSGVNAFFVRNDLLEDHFEDPFTAEHHFEPPRFLLCRRIGLYPAKFSDDG